MVGQCVFLPPFTLCSTYVYWATSQGFYKKLWRLVWILWGSRAQPKMGSVRKHARQGFRCFLDSVSVALTQNFHCWASLQTASLQARVSLTILSWRGQIFVAEFWRHWVDLFARVRRAGCMHTGAGGEDTIKIYVAHWAKCTKLLKRI